MLELEVAGRRYPILPGETLIGTDAACGVRVGAPGILERHAVVMARGGAVAIRAAVPEAPVVVNGVPLADHPAPLLHGDTVRLGDSEAVVIDRQRVPVSTDLPLAVLHARTAPMRGERFAVRVPGAQLGRADTCDVVIAQPEVGLVHSALAWRDGVWLLRAVESASPTIVDGEAVPSGSEVPLAPGSTVVLGPYRFLFEPLRDPTGPLAATEQATLMLHPPRPAPRAELPASGLPRWWVVAAAAAAVAALLGLTLFT